MENESSMKDIIKTSLDQVRTILDADTVVGRPIETVSGTTIIPISKVSMGFATGGLDLPNDQADKSFGGGGGTGVSVVPVGFLTITKEGKVDMLPMMGGKSSPLDQVVDFIDNIPALVERIKSIFTGTGISGKDEEVYAEKIAEDAANEVAADDETVAEGETAAADTSYAEAPIEQPEAGKKRDKKALNDEAVAWGWEN